MLDRMPWERMPRESRQAFEAYSIYRDQGVGRSARVVAERLGKSSTLIHRWCSEWRWVERANEYDAYTDRLLRANSEAKLTEMAERHAQSATAWMAKSLERLRELDAKDLTALQALKVFEVSVTVERAARGMLATHHAAKAGAAAVDTSDYDAISDAMGDIDVMSALEDVATRILEQAPVDRRAGLRLVGE